MNTKKPSSHRDQPGKLFRAESDGMRRCMVCEELFNQREASKHSTVPCQPKETNDTETRMAPTTPKLSEYPETEGSLSIRKLAQHYLTQGQTVRAAALMMKLAKTEPAPDNLTLLADIYMQQGLFEDAKDLYLRVVQANLESGR
jgi:hypothetical protein